MVGKEGKGGKKGGGAGMERASSPNKGLGG